MECKNKTLGDRGRGISGYGRRLCGRYPVVRKIVCERYNKGNTIPKEQLPSYYSGLINKVDASEFEVLLGHPIPDGRWSGELGINDAICQLYYAKSGLARFVYRILTDKKKKSEENGKPDLNILFIYNMPFRAIAKMTGGGVSMEMVYGIVDMVNGHIFTGLKKLVKGYFSNQKENKAYEKLLAGKDQRL